MTLILAPTAPFLFVQVHLYLDDPDAYAVGSALEGALDDAGPASSIEGVWAAGFKLLREEEAFGHADEAAASSSSNTTFLSRDRTYCPMVRSSASSTPVQAQARAADLRFACASRSAQSLASVASPTGAHPKAPSLCRRLLDQMTPSMEHVPTAGDLVRVESHRRATGDRTHAAALGQSIRELSHERSWSCSRARGTPSLTCASATTFASTARWRHVRGARMSRQARRRRRVARQKAQAVGGGRDVGSGRRRREADEHGVTNEAACRARPCA